MSRERFIDLEEWQKGDRVQILSGGVTKGAVGTIVEVTGGWPWPINVELDGGGLLAFGPNELSLIEEEDEMDHDKEEMTDDKGMIHDEYVGQPTKVNGVTVYISGPMTGKKDANYPLFNQVAKDLIGRNIEVNGEKRVIDKVLNPAELDETKGIDGEKWQSLLLRDVNAMIEENVEAVIVFDDWWNSRGSTAEAYFGRTFGWPVYEYKTDSGRLNSDVDFSITFEAQDIVLGARRYDYGHPLDNFVRIARMWNALLYDKLAEPLDVRDVAQMMIDMKQAREYNSPKRDNMVDVVGYATAYAEALREADHRNVDIGDLMSDYIRQMRRNTLVEGQEKVN